jgi:tRNA-splicing ligase RtcB
MIDAKELNQLGLPSHPAVMPLAMKLVNKAVAGGAEALDVLERIALLVKNPQAMTGDDLLGPLAEAVVEAFPGGIAFIPRKEPAPWKKWGDVDLDDTAVAQMHKASLLPVAVRGALMPDAHLGYGLPIGGVLAVKDAVIPYAVGVDIACRMRLTVLDMPVSALLKKRERLIQALEEETRFGMGAAFEKGERRAHAVMEEDWGFCRVLKGLREKAWKQLGTSGGGNHFVEFGELVLDAPALGLEKRTYLALLSHSGSRGSGEETASHYSRLAMNLRPYLPQELKHLAWLERNSAEGCEYWAAMQLMGRYASAGHELIHRHVLEHLGAEPLAHVENHHNFAWEEEHDGQTVIVHRKGATPAGPGVLGIVPGSMGSPGFVVRGKGNAGALNSCSHGAGRLMSRAAAVKSLDREKVHRFLEDRGVHLISGGLDEAPQAYKDIHAVMAAQSDLVDILARFEPRLVKMAPDDGNGKGKRFKGGKQKSRECL